jgi:hypothetical protein
MSNALDVVRPDAELAAQFLHALWPDQQGAGRLVVWSLPSKATQTYALSDLPRAVSDATRLAARADVYTGCGLQSRIPAGGKRGDADTVSAIPGVWSDVDVQGPAHKASNLPPTMDAACDLLAELPVNPTLVIDSGHGLQAWWLFREPWYFDDDAERGRAARLVLDWQALIQQHAQRHGWQLDATQDLARVLRLPGTLNHKLDPRAVRFVLQDERRRYNPAELAEFCADVAPSPSSNGTGRAKVAAQVEDRIPDGKRRANLLSVAGTMRRRGLAEPEILAALREVNTRRCDPPLDDAEVEDLAADVGERYEPVETIGRPTYTGPANAIEQTIETFEHWLHLPDLTPVLAVLGAVAANKLEGDPVWLGIVAPPSSAKTEILNALSMLPDIYPAATMSPASLLSGTSKKERAASSKGGLLREVGEFGILVLKDFGSILSMHRDARAETLAALRELYDGEWTRHVGSDGGQTLHWAGKLGLVFGATPALDAHHAASSALGERFLLCRLPDAEQVQLRRAFAHSGKQTKTMRHELAEAVAALFAGACADPEPLSSSEMDELEKIVWLAVRLRSAVQRDGYSREIEFVHGTEGPARLGLTLERLLAGLSSLGVDRARAFDVVRRACMDSVPPLRRRAHAWLSEIGTPQSTQTVGNAIGLPTNTARRVLEDLAAYGLVERESQGKGKPDIWTATRDAA